MPRIALHFQSLECLLGRSKHGIKNAIDSTGNLKRICLVFGGAMRKNKGFSLIELLIVVAIILIIAAIAIPSFLRSRMAANESAAVAALRTLNTAQVSYSSAYPTVGYASTMSALAGTSCMPPSSSGACLIDTALAAGLKSGYTFTLTNVSGTPASTYNFVANPVLWNYSGIRYFCTFADAVVRTSAATITTCDTSVSPQN
jgi:type IV pilus assembly protein PilA